MPNQSGRFVLALIILISLAALCLFFVGKERQSSSKYVTELKDIDISKSSPYLKPQNSKGCKTDFDDNDEDDQGVWEFLPDQFRSNTYKDEVVSAAEATYQLYLLRGSSDCRFLAFLIELVGRGGGAYHREDYKYRGVYIFDRENKKVLTVITMPEENIVFDGDEYGSNIWKANNYQFVLSESAKQGDFTKTRYSYDAEEGKLSESINEP